MEFEEAEKHVQAIWKGQPYNIMDVLRFIDEFEDLQKRKQAEQEEADELTAAFIEQFHKELNGDA